MKKIFDWTVGSFFRTIGRTIAFFAMATLVYYLLSYNDIDFGIKNLFFDKVDALSMDGYFDREVYVSSQWKNLITLNEFNMQNEWNFPNQVNTLNDDYVVIPIEGLYYWQYDNSDNQSSTTDLTGIRPYIHIYLKTSSNWTACEMQNNLIVCPVQHNVNLIGIQISTDPGGSWTDATWELFLYIYYNFNMYKKDTTQIIDNQNQNTQDIINSQNQNTQAITNQTQQSQQQHQETMNSSTTDAENDASSFFGNFTVEDQGGLSAIVTAPLNTIRSLLSSTCADLVLPLPFVEEDLTLPCMYSIYTQHFGAFFSLYQTIILGIIAYRCIMSIFFDIKGFTNPNDDRIEVMDL